VYREELKRTNAQLSMTDDFDYHQNALAERVNGILKQVFLLYRRNTFEDLKMLFAKLIELYNHLKGHLCLALKLRKKWARQPTPRRRWPD